MYNGKHASGDWKLFASPSGKKRGPRRWRKEFVLLLAVMTLLVGIAGGTVAYVVAASEQRDNVFGYSHVTCTVEENFNGNTKSGVKIKNTGDTDAYIRAAVIITWQDVEGNVCGETPISGEDYTWSLNTSDGWFDGGDGYYYYKNVVPEGNETPVLIERCAPEDTEPAGYTISVEILADAIQSTPVKAVVNSWAVSVANDGTISK